MQYHAKYIIQPGVLGQLWVVEAIKLAESDTRLSLLTCVLIAKVRKTTGVDGSLRQVSASNFSSWVMEFLCDIRRDGVLPVSKVPDWDAINHRCGDYICRGEKRRGEMEGQCFRIGAGIIADIGLGYAGGTGDRLMIED